MQETTIPTYRGPRHSDRYPYAVIEEDLPKRRAKKAAAPTRNTLSAREMFVARTAEQNNALAQIKLTAPQRRALDAVALENSAPIAPGSVVTDAMFAKLEAHGLVRVDLGRPHRAALTELGMAYVRRAPKGGKR